MAGIMHVTRIDWIDSTKLGWEVFEPNEHQEIHIVPIRDVLEHDDNSTECACLPLVEPIEYENGKNAGEFSGYYNVVHSAWDGRE